MATRCTPFEPGASGDISLDENQTTNEYIVWSYEKAGPYHPTPLIWGDTMYVLYDRGLLAAYDAKTGRELYGRKRIPDGGTGFTSSPWAYGDKLFCLNEDGRTFGDPNRSEVRIAAHQPIGRRRHGHGHARDRRRSVADPHVEAIVLHRPQRCRQGALIESCNRAGVRLDWKLRSRLMSQRAAAKATTHGRIVASASKLMRKQGLAAASVGRVMRGARLTVGGFYSHFRSKRTMDAEVLRLTLEEVRASWLVALDGREGLDWLAHAVGRYLSSAHRDAPEAGCPLPAVLSELARADKSTRETVARAFVAATDEFAARAPRTGGVDPRDRAMATLALCIGGLALARVLRGTPESDQVLGACAKWSLPEIEESWAAVARGPG